MYLQVATRYSSTNKTDWSSHCDAQGFRLLRLIIIFPFFLCDQSMFHFYWQLKGLITVHYHRDCNAWRAQTRNSVLIVFFNQLIIRHIVIANEFIRFCSLVHCHDKEASDQYSAFNRFWREVISDRNHDSSWTKNCPVFDQPWRVYSS